MRQPKIVLYQFQNPAPIKKAHRSTFLQSIRLHPTASSSASPIRSLVVSFINAFGLDFGAIDVVTDLNGDVAVIDVNPTPWGTAPSGVVSYFAD